MIYVNNHGYDIAPPPKKYSLTKIVGKMLSIQLDVKSGVYPTFFPKY